MASFCLLSILFTLHFVAIQMHCPCNQQHFHVIPHFFFHSPHFVAIAESLALHFVARNALQNVAFCITKTLHYVAQHLHTYRNFSGLRLYGLSGFVFSVRQGP
jgi:hypothetical protein